MEAQGSAARRRQRDKERAAALKREKVERRTGRCPVCYAIYNADMLVEGYAAHRCKTR